MKLLRVKILGQNFRSLPANVDYVFNETFEENKLSTKVFAGLNGSGKSNFLELIAEIFYYLERFCLEKTSKEYIRSKNIGFEIEYIIPTKDIISHKKRFSLLDDTIDAYIHVRIIKQLDELPEFSYSSYGDSKFVRLDNTIGQLLPTHIIAYTSGQNELLSNPFIRLRYHYFNELQNTENTLYDRRMYFIDEESNYSIFIANMLLGKEKPLNYLKKIFDVEDLYSFRITVNYKTRNKGDEQLLQSKIGLLEPLKVCASSWKNDIENKIIVLDFVVNEATHQAFNHYYNESAFQLFQVFYELQSLNLLIDKQEVRKFVVNASKVLNVSDELSKPDPSDLIFRIEKIRIKKVPKRTVSNDKNDTIYYKALSDGEHQLNEVIGSVMMMENEGSLFLMDEPDTHFNPKWRAKMVTMLNQVSGNEYDQNGNPERIRQHEIIMTTHSPFIISDNQKDNVYKFERDYKTVYNKEGKEVDSIELLDLKNPKHETYGASITFLMKQIFERDITISDYANQELITLKNEIKDIQDKELKAEKIDKIEERLLDFGESIEKFDLYNYLSLVKKD